MKKIVMLTIILMLTAVVTVAHAEVKAGSVSITPFAGGYVFERNQDLKETAVYGLRAGYNFTKNIGLEGYFSYLQTEIQDQSQWEPWQDVYSFGIEGLYHFMPESRLVPFIAIGFGGIYYSKGFNYINSSYGDDFEASQYTVDYGAGLKFFLTDDIALRADVRDVIPLNGTKGNPDYFHNNLLVTLGINFAFGGEKKIVEAKVEEPKVEEPKVEEPPPPVVEQKVEPPPPPVVEQKVEPPPPPIVEQKVEPPPVVAPAPVIIEKGRQKLNVKFNFDNSTIKKGYYKDINNLTKVMKNYPDLKVVIEGHTDSVGNAAYNKKLSQKRAYAVKKYMVAKGIGATRIKARGFGKDKPIASNKTNKGRKKNRRVEAAVDYLIKK